VTFLAPWSHCRSDHGLDCDLLSVQAWHTSTPSISRWVGLAGQLASYRGERLAGLENVLSRLLLHCKARRWAAPICAEHATVHIVSKATSHCKTGGAD